MNPLLGLLLILGLLALSVFLIVILIVLIMHYINIKSQIRKGLLEEGKEFNTLLIIIVLGVAIPCVLVGGISFIELSIEPFNFF